MRYRKKPVVVDAIQIGRHDGELPAWVMDASRDNRLRWHGDGGCAVLTDEGTMDARDTDWLIMGVEGEIYPCRDSVFRATYEREDGRPL